jgi:hypothetical protein
VRAGSDGNEEASQRALLRSDVGPQTGAGVLPAEQPRHSEQLKHDSADQTDSSSLDSAHPGASGMHGSPLNASVVGVVGEDHLAGIKCAWSATQSSSPGKQTATLEPQLQGTQELGTPGNPSLGSDAHHIQQPMKGIACQFC